MSEHQIYSPGKHYLIRTKKNLHVLHKQLLNHLRTAHHQILPNREHIDLIKATTEEQISVS